MEILQGRAFEEKLMRENGARLLKRVIFHPSSIKELGLDRKSPIDELDAYFICRKFMFKQGFRRNYHLGFYKEEEGKKLTK